LGQKCSKTVARGWAGREKGREEKLSTISKASTLGAACWGKGKSKSLHAAKKSPNRRVWEKGQGGGVPTKKGKEDLEINAQVNTL